MSKSEGNGSFFGPEMREMRDPQNGCQIGPVPLYGYNLCKTPPIRMQLLLKQLGESGANTVCTSINHSDYTVL